MDNTNKNTNAENEKENKQVVTLVVTDLDGTLLDSNKQVSQRTRNAIHQLKEHGILFGIASGRPVESGLFLSKNWGLDKDISFLIGMNGGVLYDTRQHTKEVYSWLDGEKLYDIIQKYRHIPGLHFEVMKGNDRYVEWSTPETLENAMLYGENEIIVDYDTYLKGRRFNKLIIRSLPEQQPEVAAIGKTINDEHITSFSTSDILYEFVDPAINKGYGLQNACRHFGLNLKNAVAFGDESNDIEMLMLAGQGNAMKNALPSVKAIADTVLDYTNDEDGLARYIEEVILPNAEGKLER